MVSTSDISIMSYICMICTYDIYDKLQGANCPVSAAGE